VSAAALWTLSLTVSLLTYKTTTKSPPQTSKALAKLKPRRHKSPYKLEQARFLSCQYASLGCGDETALLYHAGF